MRSVRIFVCLVFVCAFAGAISLQGQQSTPASDRPADTPRGAGADSNPTSAAQPQVAGAQRGDNAQPSVPRLIRFNGILQSLAGKAIAGPADVTFSLYADEAGGEPLWFETQTVQADALGHYTVLLGAMSPAGVPMELFTGVEARWLGVMVQGLPEQPRVLLVSVPYAMKAGDAETLAGRPASEYQLTPDASASSDSSARGTAKKGTTTARDGSKSTKNAESPVTNAFTQNYIPVFSDNAGDLTNSIMVQSGTKIGVNTNAPAFNLDVNGAVLAIGTKTPLAGAGGTMRFRDDTGTQRWLFGLPGSAGSQDFQMYNYANGHAPLYIQNGAASYSLYLNGNGNVGIGTTTPGAKLEVNQTAGGTAAIFDAPPDQLGIVVKSGGNNMFTVDSNGDAILQGNIILPNSSVTTGVLSLEGATFLHACCNATFPNTFVGPSAGNFTNTGISNTAVGWVALSALTNGSTNSALGFSALGADTTGGGNVAVGSNALYYNTTGGANTAIGGNAGVSSATGSHNTFLGGATALCGDGYNYATVIGFGAEVCESNALALGGTGTYAVNVGIGTQTPRSILDAVVNAASALGPRVTLTNSGGGAGAAAAIDFNSYNPSGSGTYNPSSRIEALDNNFSNDIAFLTNKEGAANNGLINQAEITKNGQFIVDASHNNALSISGSALSGAGLVFGGTGSGEGIASCRSDSTTCSDTEGVWTIHHQYGLDFYTSGVIAMAIDNSGIMSVPKWTVWGNGDHQGAYPSDRRLKTNIQPFPSMLDKLARLQPVNFDWKKSNPHGYPSGDKNNPGLIAQDVEKLFPAMVTTDENGFRRLSYGQLPLMLLEGVRELKQRNDNLVAEVQTQSKQLAVENAEIVKLKRVSSAKDADVRNESRQIRTLAREVEKLEKSQAEMAALEARLARLEGKSQAGSRNVKSAPGKTGKTSKPKVVQVARVGF